MKLKNLLTDDDAVSPVIGVILMVAITVILAAVIGTFVLGLGQNVQSTAPQVSFAFDQNGVPEVTITHDGGDTIAHNNIKVTVDGNAAYTDDTGTEPWNTDGNEVTAGDSETITHYEDGGETAISSGQTIRVVWTSDSGDNSQVLGEYEVA
ncbi:type IV pilin [Halobacteriales archaeon SW_6_65_15]|jgi:flagellin-like protein|nr:MAG: type IV pilin [Halobacteriales archaeon SW_6_65_15]